MTAEGLLRNAIGLRAAVKAVAGQHRRVVLMFALMVFVGFAVLSARALELSPAAVDWRLLALAVATMPAAIWLNAQELRLCARAVGGAMPFRVAVLDSAVATLLNVVPLPAGLAWRARALHRSGAGWFDGGRILALAGGLWFALALVGVGIALAGTFQGHGVLAAGALSAASIVLWIARRCGVRIAAGFLLVRAAALLLLVVRLAIILAAIGQATAIADVGVFAVAGVIGNGVAVVPGGLGVVEGVGALMAGLVEIRPGAAFLALAIGRLIGYGAAALCVLPALLRGDGDLVAAGVRG